MSSWDALGELEVELASVVIPPEGGIVGVLGVGLKLGKLMLLEELMEGSACAQKESEVSRRKPQKKNCAVKFRKSEI